MGAVFLLRSGVLLATGGGFDRFDEWRTHGDGHTISFHARTSDDTVTARYVGCWTMLFSPHHAILATGTMTGTNLSASRAEWTIDWMGTRGAVSRVGSGWRRRAAARQTSCAAATL